MVLTPSCDSISYVAPHVKAACGTVRQAVRGFASAPNLVFSEQLKQKQKRHTVTLVRGDGIGPEVTNSVISAFAAMRAPVDWEAFDMLDPKACVDTRAMISEDLCDSIKRNKFVLKGPLATPPGKQFISPDVTLARTFGLFAHVVPVTKLPGIKTRHEHIDLVVIRENTEGEYSGLEHEVNPGVVQSLKVITKGASRAIAEYAFQYALKNNRKRVAAVHKANIMKMADGLFLSTAREVAGLYQSQVDFRDVIIDNCCMQIVSKPEQFDVVVTGNLYGNILSEAAAGLVGSPGLIPGYNVGKDVRMYEQGPRHTGSDIAGQNKANPVGFLLASCLMLRDMNLGAYADALEHAVKSVVAEQDPAIITSDIGGKGTTTGFTQAIVNRLKPIEA